MALFSSANSLFKSRKSLFPKDEEQPQSVYSPYIPQAKEEVDKERKKTGVLQWLFDRLSTGQYVVANLVDEIITSAEDGDPAAKDFLDVLRAMGQGVTGKRKGDFAEILKRRLPEGDFTKKPLLEYGRELNKKLGTWNDKREERLNEKMEKGAFLTKTTGADLVGFLANVFLDPMTYINPFSIARSAKGAIPGAKAVAEDSAILLSKALTGGADDATRAALKGITNLPDDVLKRTFKGLDGDKLSKLLDSNQIAKAQEYISGFVGKDIAKFQAQAYKNVYRNALYTNADDLQKQMLTKLGIDTDEFAVPAKLAVESLPVEGGIREIGERAVRGYPAGSGKTKMGDFFGIELGVKHRPGKMQWTNRVAQIFQNKLGGSKLSDAWWTIMNRKAPGEIRKALGIYNPYQRYLRQIELDSKRGAEDLANTWLRQYAKLRSPAPEITDAAQWLIVKAEELGKQAGYGKGLSGQELLQMASRINTPKEIADIIAKNPEAVIKSADNLRSMLNTLHESSRNFGPLKFLDEHYLTNYFPKNPRNATGGIVSQNFSKTRTFTWNETKEATEAALRVWGDLTPEMAERVVKENATNFITNIDELMTARIYAQARMESKVNMIKKFQQLGLPIKNFEGENLGEAVAKLGHRAELMGLKSIDHPALEGFLYDKDVADILDRILKSTGKEMGRVQRAFTNQTKWWRALVTTTTGFHARNFISNNFTGFMKHGAKWFDPALDYEAAVGVIYATQRNNPQIWAKMAAENFDIDEKTFYRILNRTVGEGKSAKSLREMVDDGLRTGVISQNTQGFDAVSKAMQISTGDKYGVAKRISSFNPFPQGIINQNNSPDAFVVFKASRALGNVVENTPRFKSFILDYIDLSKLDNARIDTLIRDGVIDGSKESIDSITKYATDYASLEAKKWFIDYEDLTEFEQKVLKNIIPFYTWLRKNIANQVSGMILYPGIYSLVPKAEELMTYQDPEYDPSLVPDYMKQLGYFPVGKLEEKVFTLLNPNLPFQDLARIPLSWEEGNQLPKWSLKEVKDDIVGAAHPIIKTIVEMIPDKGYDTWRKKELDPRSEAPRVLRMFTKTPRLLQMFDGILRFAGFKEGLNPRINEEGKLELNSKVLKVIENNLPLVRTADQLFQSGSVLFGQDEAIRQSYEAMAQEKNPVDAMNKLFNVLSYWGGIKQKGLDLGKEEDRYYRDIYNKAGQLRGDELLGAAEIKKRLQRQKKDTERIRKLTR